MDELAVLLAGLEHHGQRTALIQGEDRFCYDELARRVRCLAAHLATSGFGPRHALATILPNCVDQVVTHLAALLAGVPIVRLNATFAPAQIAHCLKTIIPHGLVSAPGHLAALRSEITLDPFQILLAAGPDGRPSLGAKAPQKYPGQVPVHSPCDIATVTFTSGTTARPKGVIHSRGGGRLGHPPCGAYDAIKP